MKKFLTLALAVGMMYNVASAQTARTSTAPAVVPAGSVGAIATSSIGKIVSLKTPAAVKLAVIFPVSYANKLAVQMNSNPGISAASKETIASINASVEEGNIDKTARLGYALRVLAVMDANPNMNNAETKALLTLILSGLEGKFDAAAHKEVMKFLEIAEKSLQGKERNAIELSAAVNRAVLSFKNNDKTKAAAFVKAVSSNCASAKGAI